MAKTQLVSAPQLPGPPPPPGTAARGFTPLDTTEVNVMVGGSIDSIRQEIDDAFEDMKTFYNREPDEIMRTCSGHSARLSEIRVRIMRVEDMRREWKNVRTREVEPALEEIDRQYATASRLHSVRELDFKISGGQV